MIRSIIKKIAYTLIPVKDVILFESVPDMSDNTRAVFDEMIKRGLNKKYKMVWIVENLDLDKLPQIPNVSYVKLGSKEALSYERHSKCLICCNRWLHTRREKGQKSFYICHGTTIKSVRGYYTLPSDIDYCIVPSKGVVSLYENELMAPVEKIIPLGYPRNDVLTTANTDLKPLFPEVDFDKIIVWYPTYRQHKNGKAVATGNSLPIIHDENKAKELNEFAKENKVLIVLKPHFAQNVSYIKDLNLSNIKFIDDSFFVKNGITSYEFVGSCDALISDYSSIYYDYTLCDKPIALIWEDIEDYRKTPGIAKGVEPLLAGGQKVYTIDELKDFVFDVHSGVDKLQEDRRKVCDIVNYSTEGKDSQRVTDFIIEKGNL